MFITQLNRTETMLFRKLFSRKLTNQKIIQHKKTQVGIVCSFSYLNNAFLTSCF